MGKMPMPWSFYILGAGETPAPQPEAATTCIVVQASSLPGMGKMPMLRERILEGPFKFD